MKKHIFLLLFLCNLAFAQTDFTLKFATTNEFTSFLYKECFNQILIDAPNIPDSLFFPILSISKGTIWKNWKDKRKFQVFTEGEECILFLKNKTKNGDTIPLATFQLALIEPPNPIIEVELNGVHTYISNEFDGLTYMKEDFNGKRAYIPNMFAQKGDFVNINFGPDSLFAKRLPDNARYVLEKTTVFMARKGQSPRKIPFDGKCNNRIPLPNACFLFPNTKIYVQYEGIRRYAFGQAVLEKGMNPYKRILVFASR